MPLINVPSNCKYHILDNIVSELYGANSEEAQVEKLKGILKRAKIVVQVNTTSEKIKDMILKNFETYACNALPVGYGGMHGNYQYHITIKNTYSNAGNNQYLKPLDNKVVDKDKVSQALTKILKQKRRKTDIVDLLLKEI